MFKKLKMIEWTEKDAKSLDKFLEEKEREYNSDYEEAFVGNLFGKNINKMLYILSVNNRDLYKIGQTNNITRRIKELQTGCPYKINIEIVFYPDICDPYGYEISFFENFLHNYFKSKKHLGEWYKLKE